MDASVLKKMVILFISILAAYFIADALTSILLRAAHISGAAGAVAGLILFGLLFFLILQGIGKITGTDLFRSGPV